MRQLVNLTLEEQRGVVAALAPATDGTPESAAQSRGRPRVTDGTAKNRARLARMTGLIADELAAAEAAAQAPPTRTPPRTPNPNAAPSEAAQALERAKQLYGQAEALHAEAERALADLATVAAGGEGAPPLLDSARAAEAKLVELQRLFFSVVTLRELVREQGETATTPPRPRARTTPGARRACPAWSIARPVTSSSPRQSPARWRPRPTPRPRGAPPSPRRGPPGPETFGQAATEVRTALGAMQDASATLTQARDQAQQMSFDMNPALASRPPRSTPSRTRCGSCSRRRPSGTSEISSKTSSSRTKSSRTSSSKTSNSNSITSAAAPAAPRARGRASARAARARATARRRRPVDGLVMAPARARWLIAATVALLAVLLGIGGTIAQPEPTARYQLGSKAFVGSPFILAIVVDELEETPAVKAPDLAVPGLDVVRGDADYRQGFQVTFNGRRVQQGGGTWIFTYRVTAAAAGTSPLPSLTIAQGAVTATLRAANLEVVDLPSTKDMAITVELPTRPVYIGETFTAEVHWLLRNPQGQQFGVPLLAMDGILGVAVPTPTDPRQVLAFATDKGEQSVFTQDRVTQDGVTYDRLRFPLRVTARKSGKLTIPAASVVADIKIGSGRDALGFPVRRTETLPRPRSGPHAGGAPGARDRQAAAVRRRGRLDLRGQRSGLALGGPARRAPRVRADPEERPAPRRRGAPGAARQARAGCPRASSRCRPRRQIGDEKTALSIVLHFYSFGSKER